MSWPLSRLSVRNSLVPTKLGSSYRVGLKCSDWKASNKTGTCLWVPATCFLIWPLMFWFIVEQLIVLSHHFLQYLLYLNNHVSVKKSMKMLLWRLWGEIVALIPCSIPAEGLKLMLNILFWPVSDSSINPCARHFCCQCSQSASFLLFLLPSCYWKYEGAYFVTVLTMRKQICRQD